MRRGGGVVWVDSFAKGIGLILKFVEQSTSILIVGCRTFGCKLSKMSYPATLKRIAHKNDLCQRLIVIWKTKPLFFVLQKICSLESTAARVSVKDFT
jgi:hypothetical protein